MQTESLQRQVRLDQRQKLLGRCIRILQRGLQLQDMVVQASPVTSALRLVVVEPEIDPSHLLVDRASQPTTGVTQRLEPSSQVQVRPRDQQIGQETYSIRVRQGESCDKGHDDIQPILITACPLFANPRLLPHHLVQIRGLTTLQLLWRRLSRSNSLLFRLRSKPGPRS